MRMRELPVSDVVGHHANPFFLLPAKEEKKKKMRHLQQYTGAKNSGLNESLVNKKRGTTHDI